jgi:hypothetical protein
MIIMFSPAVRGAMPEYDAPPLVPDKATVPDTDERPLPNSKNGSDAPDRHKFKPGFRLIIDGIWFCQFVKLIGRMPCT